MRYEDIFIIVLLAVVVILYYTLIRIYMFLRMFKKLNEEHDVRIQRIERDLGIRNWTND